MNEFPYGRVRSIAGSPDEVEPRVRQALADEGFGVLTEIDVAATFAAKLGKEFPAYRILGACNPGFAHEALSEELNLGLLLPCNVIVYDAGEGRTNVAVIDPVKQLGVAGRAELEPIAGQVAERLNRALAGL